MAAKNVLLIGHREPIHVHFIPLLIGQWRQKELAVEKPDVEIHETPEDLERSAMAHLQQGNHVVALVYSEIELDDDYWLNVMRLFTVHSIALIVVASVLRDSPLLMPVRALRAHILVLPYSPVQLRAVVCDAFLPQDAQNSAGP